ncbi:PH domain-containing protein, partial [Streptomyces sp. DH12]
MSGTQLPELPVTFRPGRTRAVLLTAGVALFVVVSLIGLLLDGLGPGERISFVFTAALLAGALFLLARPKIVADEAGVTVVNIVHRRRLEWAEILQVNLRSGDPWVFLDLSDGTSLP